MSSAPGTPVPPLSGTPDRPITSLSAAGGDKKKKSEGRKQLTGRAVERREIVKHLALTYRLMLYPGKT